MLSHKKIAFIGVKGLPPEFPGTSGIEFYVDNLAQKLIKENNQVRCYVRNWATSKNQSFYKQIRLIHLPSLNTKHLDAFSHSFLASIHVCSNDSEIVWYQAIGPAFFSFIPKLLGKTIYTTVHGLDWKREKWEWWARIFLRFCEKLMVSYTDKIFVVSRDLQKYYWKKYRCQTFYQPMTMPQSKKLKPNIITKKYGLKGNDYILFMGRFVPEKRVDWIIKAYQELKPKNIKLVLAGGSSHTEKYTRQLHKIATSNANIIFTDYVFGKEKWELLSNSHLFILPSSVEGSSISLVEANRFNIFCLLSDIYQHRLIATKYKHVILFRNDNFLSFLSKLKLLI